MVEPKLWLVEHQEQVFFDLFGYDLKDYDELFEEKLGLLLELNKTERITWSGKYRPELRNMKIFPRPIDNILPIWRAVGGPPASAIKAENKVCQ